MTESVPPYSPTLLGQSLDAAVSRRQLPDPTTTEASNRPNRSDSEAYIKAVRIRLKTLGFLARKSPVNGSVDDQFTDAVSRFQRSVHLKTDGWIGPRTWQVLDYLFSFEAGQDPEQWLYDWLGSAKLGIGELDLLNNLAVRRAVYLRLFCMGFFPADSEKTAALHRRTNTDPHENPLFQMALTAFSGFTQTLGLAGSDLDGQLSMSLLKLVFGYDRIVEAIVMFGDFSVLEQKNRRQLEAIARIELWLSGYDVTPGPDRTVRVDKGPRRFRRFSSHGERSTLMAEAIASYWNDHRELQPPATPEKTISRALFLSFADSLQAPAEDETDMENRVEERLRSMMTEPEAREAFASQFAKLSNSIWDGFRRLSRWLARMLKKALATTVDTLANLARYISRRARQSFVTVTRAIDIIHGGLGYLFGRTGSSSRDGIAAFTHDGGLDQRTLLDPGAALAPLQACLEKHRLQGRLFQSAARIVGHLLCIAREVIISITSPVAGWLRGLLVLTKLTASIEAIRAEVEMIRQYDREHPVTPHALSPFVQPIS